MSEKPVVTITSEYGHNSPYPAVIKGILLSRHPEIQFTDISHEVVANDILAASYLLKYTAAYFPQGTIHLICVDVNLVRFKKVLLAKSSGQYYLGADNGIFSLLFRNTEAEIFAVNPELYNETEAFPEKGIFTLIASKLIEQHAIGEFAVPSEITTIRETLTPSVENNNLKGSIIFIDGYQNIITDIDRLSFDKMSAQWPNFQILYRRRSGIRKISEHYDDEKSGEVIALFNSAGLLEIAMKHGQAQSLLGLRVGGNIIIEFYD